MNEILPQLHHAHIALDALPLLFLQKILFCLTSTPQFWDECHVFHSTGMAEPGGGGGKGALPPHFGRSVNPILNIGGRFTISDWVPKKDRAIFKSVVCLLGDVILLLPRYTN